MTWLDRVLRRPSEVRRARPEDPARVPAREPIPPDAGFTITYEWKELVHYREGSRSFTFDAGWGVSPAHVYVPSAARWDRTVPRFLRGRRDEVVERLWRHSGHVVESDAD